jgi:hypothetical protein
MQVYKMRIIRHFLFLVYYFLPETLSSKPELSYISGWYFMQPSDSYKLSCRCRAAN